MSAGERRLTAVFLGTVFAVYVLFGWAIYLLSSYVIGFV